uniref:Ig-like domain-containing protein n=1 Tax=Electrophorus electricus TaxID=8005 RepID=A0A4W4EWJ8_ELEEL
VQSPPASIFGMSQCGSGSDGFLTLGCLTSGFSPADALKFKWTDSQGKELTEFTQYPMAETSGSYTSVSHVQVKASDWNTEKSFMCTAEHPAGSKTETLKKEVVPDHPASLLLTSPTEKELENGTATFICLASHFSPKTYEFKWTLDSVDVSTQATDLMLKEEKNNFSAISILKIKANQWIYSSSPIKCEFKQDKWTFSREAKHTGDLRCPSVYLLAPPEKSPDEEWVTLTCYVKNFYPKEVVVIWLANDKPVEGDKARTTSVIERDGHFSVYSQLLVQDWEQDSVVYSCVVYHEANDQTVRLIARTTDSKSNTPTLVNFSMNVPSVFPIMPEICHIELMTTDVDDSCMKNTALTFVVLFLITLFYSIAATVIKVRQCP